MKVAVMVQCSTCEGRGQVPLTGMYRLTLAQLRLAGTTTASEMAGDGTRCSSTAMSNRLAALYRLGLATRERDGRRVLYTAVAE